MITARHLVIAAFLMLSLVGIIQAQDRSPLREGFYEAEDIEWVRSGEWTRITRDGVTWYSSGYSGSSLQAEVEGLWIVFYPYREYGPARTFIKLNECFLTWESKSAHEVPRALVYKLDGPTTIEFQAVDGRSGLDAIELVKTDEKRIRSLTGQGGVYFPWQPTFSECVKQDVTPTPQQPWTNEVHRPAQDQPLGPMTDCFVGMIKSALPFVLIAVGVQTALGVLGLMVKGLGGSEKKKNG